MELASAGHEGDGSPESQLIQTADGRRVFDGPSMCPLRANLAVTVEDDFHKRFIGAWIGKLK
ncbi:hypothetical protein [Rhizobium leguminosarum]|uniref:hypothetical protein n=1 Tax=Rhizobium leguminosarum TaxID=384 RepID=UPI0004268051|nr:hypothetical protein [Rhizobium leguminosarum]